MDVGVVGRPQPAGEHTGFAGLHHSVLVLPGVLTACVEIHPDTSCMKRGQEDGVTLNACVS